MVDPKTTPHTPRRMNPASRWIARVTGGSELCDAVGDAFDRLFPGDGASRRVVIAVAERYFLRLGALFALGVVAPTLPVVLLWQQNRLIVEQNTLLSEQAKSERVASRGEIVRQLGRTNNTMGDLQLLDRTWGSIELPKSLVIRDKNAMRMMTVQLQRVGMHAPVSGDPNYDWKDTLWAASSLSDGGPQQALDTLSAHEELYRISMAIQTVILRAWLGGTHNPDADISNGEWELLERTIKDICRLERDWTGDLGSELLQCIETTQQRRLRGLGQLVNGVAAWRTTLQDQLKAL